MCGTCGCASEIQHGHGHGRTVPLEVDVLAKNDGLAAANRAEFARRGIVVLNLMSSPGSGKTTLLERTVRSLGAEPHRRTPPRRSRRTAAGRSC